MSIQLTWLATNITAPGSGVPTRRRRKPNTRINPADHARITRWSRRSPPATRRPAVNGVISSSVNGRCTSRCHSSIGTRTR